MPLTERLFDAFNECIDKPAIDEPVVVSRRMIRRVSGEECEIRLSLNIVKLNFKDYYVSTDQCSCSLS